MFRLAHAGGGTSRAAQRSLCTRAAQASALKQRIASALEYLERAVDADPTNDNVWNARQILRRPLL